MSEGARPGGLTVLAVLNFVIAGFAAMVQVFSALWLLAPQWFTGSDFDELRAQMPPDHVMWMSVGAACVILPLLVASGVGYLKRRRFLGRTLGNAYAVLTLLGAALFIAQTELMLMHLVDLVYPVLTLVLLNTTFRDDLVQ